MAQSLKLNNHSKLGNGIAKLYDINSASSKFSDIKVKVGERIFYCHKFVLHINSRYFDDILLAEDTITLNDIDPTAFQDVLHFMYTGVVQLLMRNIESILSATDILHMVDLKSLCFEFLDKEVESDAMQCWHLAKKYGLDVIGEKCHADLTKYFKKLHSIDSLVHASSTMMKFLIGANNLNISSESEVCETLIKWLKLRSESGKETKSDELLPILHLIRWSAIREEYIRETLLTNPVLAYNPDCIAFLSKVIDYLLTGVQFSGLITFHRPSTEQENCLIALGTGQTDGKTLTNMMSQEIYKVNLQKPQSSTVIANVKALTQQQRACTINKTTVYLTGSEVATSCKETWKLEMDSTSASTQKCADMITGRYEHCTAAVNSMVYVLGGKQAGKSDGVIVLTSVECFDTLRNTWNVAGEIMHAVSNAACVTYKKQIYLFGGVNSENIAIDHVQVYNPGEKTCKVLEQAMLRPTYCLRAVLWETSVILINKTNCLIYNFETEAWIERMKYKADLQGFGLVLENRSIYIIGGRKQVTKTVTFNNYQTATYTTWECTSDTKRASVIDILEDKGETWQGHSSLTKGIWLSEYTMLY